MGYRIFVHLLSHPLSIFAHPRTLQLLWKMFLLPLLEGLGKKAERRKRVCLGPHGRSRSSVLRFCAFCRGGSQLARWDPAGFEQKTAWRLFCGTLCLCILVRPSRLGELMRPSSPNWLGETQQVLSRSQHGDFSVELCVCGSWIGEHGCRLRKPCRWLKTLHILCSQWVPRSASSPHGDKGQ